MTLSSNKLSRKVGHMCLQACKYLRILETDTDLNLSVHLSKSMNFLKTPIGLFPNHGQQR